MAFLNGIFNKPFPTYLNFSLIMAFKALEKWENRHHRYPALKKQVWTSLFQYFSWEKKKKSLKKRVEPKFFGEWEFSLQSILCARMRV